MSALVSGYKHLPDGDLVNLIINNKSQHTQEEIKEIFRTLINPHLGHIFGIINKKLNDTDAAEDITQEVFIKVYNNLNQIEVPESFNYWLIKIAINLTKNYIRWKIRHHTVPFPEIADHDLENAAQQSLEVADHDQKTPLENAAQQELQEQLQMGLSSLSDEERAVVNFKFFKNYKLIEIAKILNITHNKAKCILQESLKILRNNPTLRQHINDI
jgi:RNA polymerase sigma-70 factor (ECF subfamily)